MNPEIEKMKSDAAIATAVSFTFGGPMAYAAILVVGTLVLCVAMIPVALCFEIKQVMLEREGKPSFYTKK